MQRPDYPAAGPVSTVAMGAARAPTAKRTRASSSAGRGAVVKKAEAPREQGVNNRSARTARARRTSATSSSSAAHWEGDDDDVLMLNVPRQPLTAISESLRKPPLIAALRRWWSVAPRPRRIRSTRVSRLLHPPRSLFPRGFAPPDQPLGEVPPGSIASTSSLGCGRYGGRALRVRTWSSTRRSRSRRAYAWTRRKPGTR